MLRPEGAQTVAQSSLAPVSASSENTIAARNIHTPPSSVVQSPPPGGAGQHSQPEAKAAPRQEERSHVIHPPRVDRFCSPSGPSAPPVVLATTITEPPPAKPPEDPRIPRASTSRSSDNSCHRLHHSLVVQADGYCLLHTGERISWDLFAGPEDSHCAAFGPMVHPWSTETALFNGDYDQLPEVVALAQEEKCRGVWVVPVWPKHKSTAHPAPWYAKLRASALCVLSVRREATTFRQSRAGLVDNPRLPSWGIQIIIVDFGRHASIPVSPVEPLVTLSILDVFPDQGATKLGPHAFILTELTRDPANGVPVKGEPPGDPPLPFSTCAPPEPKLSFSFDKTAFSSILQSYPNKLTRDFLEAGLREGFKAHFLGDRSIHRDSPNMPSVRNCEEGAKAVRKKAVEEVGKGWMMGPFPAYMFPNKWCPHQPRNTAMGAREKNKWDVFCKLMRPVNNASYGGRWSLNKLTLNPNISMLWTRANWILDMVAWGGKGTAIIAADIMSAYRNLPLHLKDMHLFVRKLTTKEFGTEFFLDMKAPFGWINSYWIWESLASVISFALRKRGVPFLVRYVDNWYIIVPGLRGNSHLRDEAEITRQSNIFYQLMEELDMPVHEQQVSKPEATVLGIIVNPSTASAKLKPERMVLIRALLTEWGDYSTVSVKKLEQITGLFYYVAGLFTLGKPDLVHFFKLRTKGQKTAERLKRSASEVSVTLSKQVKASLQFWKTFFFAWDGCFKLSIPHGPCAKWGDIWYCDASDVAPAWGVGAFSSELGQFVSLQWSADERSSAMRAITTSSAHLEAMAIVKALRSFGPQSTNRSVALVVDADDVAVAFQKGYAKNPELHEQIILARRCALFWNISLSCIQVSRTKNSIADALARGLVDKARCLARKQFGPGPWIRAPPPEPQPSAWQAL
jgi:hypothetical protein